MHRIELIIFFNQMINLTMGSAPIQVRLEDALYIGREFVFKGSDLNSWPVGHNVELRSFDLTFF